MPVTYKNETDGPPAVTVDLTPGAAPGAGLSAPRWYESQWATDQALFANVGARDPTNFYTDGTFLSRVRVFIVALPAVQWSSFRRNQRHLYFRIGSGTSQNMATWLWSV